MRLLTVYRTEMDWCALVEQGDWHATLTYAAQPDEAQALADGERALAAASSELPLLSVDEQTSADEKREQLLTQVAALQTFVSAHAEAFADAAALAAALAGMAAQIGAPPETEAGA